MIREIFEKHNNIIDPHTGLAAARSKRGYCNTYDIWQLLTLQNFRIPLRLLLGLIPELPELLKRFEKRKETFIFK